MKPDPMTKATRVPTVLRARQRGLELRLEHRDHLDGYAASDRVVESLRSPPAGPQGRVSVRASRASFRLQEGSIRRRAVSAGGQYPQEGSTIIARKKLSLLELARRFSSENKARRWFERLIWPDGERDCRTAAASTRTSAEGAIPRCRTAAGTVAAPSWRARRCLCGSGRSRSTWTPRA